MTQEKIKSVIDFTPYLKKTYFIDISDLTVQNKVKSLLKDVNEQDELADIKKAIKLFYFVRDEIKYVVKFSKKYYSRKNTKASVTLNRGYGYCIQKATLLATMARIAGIPSRLHFVDMKNHLTPQSYIDRIGSNLFIYHAYPELFLNGKWVEANVAFDKQLCERKNFPVVDFDGIKPGLFAKQDATGRPFIEYLKDHGTFKDVPYWKIIWAWKKVYNF